MSLRMRFQQWRAQRILARFMRYVDDAERARKIGERNFGANIDTPTIARTKPRTYARIKRSVAWRLMAKGRKP